MDIHEAFTMFVRKYYEGYDYSNVKKANGGKFEYDFKSLDKIHKELVPKSKKSMKDSADDEEQEAMLGNMKDDMMGKELE